MAASNSMSLRATAAVVIGNHGSVVTDSKYVEFVATHSTGFEERKSSLVVSKFEDM